MASLVSAISSLSYPALAALVFVGLPVLVVVVNVASQLLPQDTSRPPVVFHWVPFIGSMIAYGMDPLTFLFEAREKHGDIFTFIMFGRKMTVALGPKGNNFILGGKVSEVSAEEAYHPITTPVFGEGVVYDVPNHVLMEQKKFVKFGLSTDNFRTYVGLIENEVDLFLQNYPAFENYRKGDTTTWDGSFHAFKAMSELTIFTASRTLQGEEVRNALDGSFADLYHDLDGGFQPINMLFPNLPLPAYRKRDRAQKKMSDFYVEIQQKRKDSTHDHDHDMLAALADQRYKNGAALTEREIAHIMIALLMAGQHTSSATSAWTLLHLAFRGDIWQSLYEEQIQHFSQPDGSLRSMEYEEIRNLPVMDSVIRETLRIHPPIHSIMRAVKADIVVPASIASPSTRKSDNKSYIVPKGHFLLASPAVSQVDPKIWKDAKTWDPTRWADAQGVAAQAGSAYDDIAGEKIDYGFGAVSKGTDSPYQPFGAGRHRCIGEQFAYIQLSTILATLVRKIDIKIPKVPGHNYTTMIVTPLEPQMISYRRRA